MFDLETTSLSKSTSSTFLLTFRDTKASEILLDFLCWLRWSGGVMVLGKLPVPGRPTIWITVGQGPTAHVVGASGGCLDIYTLIYPFLSSFSSLYID